MDRRWSNEEDLAALILVRAHEKRQVVLSPDTALFVGLKLMAAAKKPTTAEVARLLCDFKCEKACYACQGRANAIVRVYGHRVG